jgi:cobyrinic acid a,c-diamide synthase
MQGIVVAGTHSGSGKTTVTLAILAALTQRGYRVQSFKAGPDFIDAGLHGVITGRPSRNLDLWMCGEEYVRACYRDRSRDADLSVVEGAMGLYDGSTSTARLSSLLRLPVVLVIDAYGMAESAGAVLQGFMNYGLEGADRAAVKGVIFNRVGSTRHLERLKSCVRDIPVVGHLARDSGLEIPQRHLGLTVADEAPLTKGMVESLAHAAEEHFDIETIVRLAGPASADAESASVAQSPLPHHTRQQGPLRMAVARDVAFCFYYEDNLDLLRASGFTIVPFSPLNDPGLPEDADAVYLGGGYPELYAARLAENVSMRRSIRSWSETGNTLYAECGGLMYLSRGIHDGSGAFLEMCGVLPFATRMKRGRVQLGYREVILTDDCIVGKRGERLRGHEFHYSEIVPGEETRTLSTGYALRDQNGRDLSREGYMINNTLASYVHLHFGSNAAAAENAAGLVRKVGKAEVETGCRCPRQ